MTNEMMNKWPLRLSLAFLAACATIAQATAQGVPQGERGGGPPNVTITQVIELSNTGGQRNFRVEWTAQKPPLTTILKYAVTLEVKFTGGGAQTDSKKLPATATSATFSFSGAPANAAALEFKASVNTTFTTPESGSTTTTREFDLTTDSFQGGVGSGGPLPADRPLIQIASAKAVDLKTFDVTWNAQAAQGINIERFGVSGLVTYVFRPLGAGSTTAQSQVSIVSGSNRQGRILINNPPQRGNPFASRIKITIETAFNRFVERIVQSNKEGRF